MYAVHVVAIRLSCHVVSTLDLTVYSWNAHQFSRQTNWLIFKNCLLMPRAYTYTFVLKTWEQTSMFGQVRFGRLKKITWTHSLVSLVHPCEKTKNRQYNKCHWTSSSAASPSPSHFETFFSTFECRNAMLSITVTICYQLQWRLWVTHGDDMIPKHCVRPSVWVRSTASQSPWPQCLSSSEPPRVPSG